MLPPTSIVCATHCAGVSSAASPHPALPSTPVLDPEPLLLSASPLLAAFVVVLASLEGSVVLDVLVDIELASVAAPVDASPVLPLAPPESLPQPTMQRIAIAVTRTRR